MGRLKEYLATTLYVVVLSLLIATSGSGVQLVASWLGIAPTPTWQVFVCTTALVFVSFFGYSVFKTALFYWRCWRNPAFKDMNIRMGATWKEFKAADRAYKERERRRKEGSLD